MPGERPVERGAADLLPEPDRDSEPDADGQQLADAERGAHSLADADRLADPHRLELIDPFRVSDLELDRDT